MISELIVANILRRLAAGEAYRAIAAAEGVSIGSVRNIAAGRPRRQRRQPTPATVRITPTRCPTCRQLVTELPCRLCTVRDLKRGFAA